MIASTAVGIFFSASQARKDYTRPYDKSEMGLYGWVAGSVLNFNSCVLSYVVKQWYESITNYL